MENELESLRKENAALRAELERYKNAHRRSAAATNSKLTPEQRRANAKKAVVARMAKYGQKSRK